MPPELTADPYPTFALVSALRSRIARPQSAIESARFDQLSEALCRGSGADAAVALLSPPPTTAGARMSAFLLATIATNLCRGRGAHISDEARLLQVVRQEIRNDLASLPTPTTPDWLIPATTTAGDRTGAHVAALALNRHGTATRPWLWSQLPAQGCFIIVGANARHHPAVAHPRCAGIGELAHLAQSAQAA